MAKLFHQYFYQRNLPHYHPIGSTYFITFRLAGSIPRQKQLELEEEFAQIQTKIDNIANPVIRRNKLNLARKRYFGKFDFLLDNAVEGPTWLQAPDICSIISGELISSNGSTIDIYSYCIMPNHVHLVCQPRCKEDGSEYPLPDVMRMIKGRSAFLANQKLKRDGQFWQHESYDHVIQNDAELERVIRYVVYNPVKAGLAEDWDQWKGTYCRYEM